MIEQLDIVQWFSAIDSNNISMMESIFDEYGTDILNATDPVSV